MSDGRVVRSSSSGEAMRVGARVGSTRLDMELRVKGCRAGWASGRFSMSVISPVSVSVLCEYLEC